VKANKTGREQVTFVWRTATNLIRPVGSTVCTLYVHVFLNISASTNTVTVCTIVIVKDFK